MDQKNAKFHALQKASRPAKQEASSDSEDSSAEVDQEEEDELSGIPF
jgi:hypothetical protein